MWLTETPWPPAAVLLALAVIFGVLWSRSGRAVFVALAGFCLVLIAGAFVVERMVVTPGEEVERQIDALRAAVVSDDVEGTLAFFSPTALTERTAVAAGMAIARITPGVRVTDVTVDVTAQDTIAVSHFRANGTIVGRGGMWSGEEHAATRWRASWRKEAGEWKIFALERLNPITGETINILSRE